MVTDVFNKIVTYVKPLFILMFHYVDEYSCCLFRSCHTKCISTRYAEGDLNKGESVCIDRCVAKFFEANKKVGERLQSVGANAMGSGGPMGV